MVWYIETMQDEIVPSNFSVVFTTDQINAVVTKCATQIQNALTSMNNTKEVVFVGILKGGAYFLCDLTRAIPFAHTIDFMQISSYGNSQSQSVIKINCSFDASKYINHIIVLVDELVDNGATLENAKEFLVKRGIKAGNIFTCVAFIKNTKYCDMVNFYGLVVPDPNLWLVGYGLDDSQHYRNCRNLYAKLSTD